MIFDDYYDSDELITNNFNFNFYFLVTKRVYVGNQSRSSSNSASFREDLQRKLIYDPATAPSTQISGFNTPSASGFATPMMPYGQMRAPSLPPLSTLDNALQHAGYSSLRSSSNPRMPSNSSYPYQTDQTFSNMATPMSMQNNLNMQPGQHIPNILTTHTIDARILTNEPYDRNLIIPNSPVSPDSPNQRKKNKHSNKEIDSDSITPNTPMSQDDSITANTPIDQSSDEDEEEEESEDERVQLHSDEEDASLFSYDTVAESLHPTTAEDSPMQDTEVESIVSGMNYSDVFLDASENEMLNGMDVSDDDGSDTDKADSDNSQVRLDETEGSEEESDGRELPTVQIDGTDESDVEIKAVEVEMVHMDDTDGSEEEIVGTDLPMTQLADTDHSAEEPNTAPSDNESDFDIAHAMVADTDEDAPSDNVMIHLADTDDSDNGRRNNSRIRLSDTDGSEDDYMKRDPNQELIHQVGFGVKKTKFKKLPVKIQDTDDESEIEERRIVKQKKNNVKSPKKKSKASSLKKSKLTRTQKALTNLASKKDSKEISKKKKKSTSNKNADIKVTKIEDSEDEHIKQITKKHIAASDSEDEHIKEIGKKHIAESDSEDDTVEQSQFRLSDKTSSDEASEEFEYSMEQLADNDASDIDHDDIHEIKKDVDNAASISLPLDTSILSKKLTSIGHQDMSSDEELSHEESDDLDVTKSTLHDSDEELTDSDVKLGEKEKDDDHASIDTTTENNDVDSEDAPLEIEAHEESKSEHLHQDTSSIKSSGSDITDKESDNFKGLKKSAGFITLDSNKKLVKMSGENSSATSINSKKSLTTSIDTRKSSTTSITSKKSSSTLKGMKKDKSKTDLKDSESISSSKSKKSTSKVQKSKKSVKDIKNPDANIKKGIKKSKKVVKDYRVVSKEPEKIVKDTKKASKDSKKVAKGVKSSKGVKKTSMDVKLPKKSKSVDTKRTPSSSSVKKIPIDGKTKKVKKVEFNDLVKIPTDVSDTEISAKPMKKKTSSTVKKRVPSGSMKDTITENLHPHRKTVPISFASSKLIGTGSFGVVFACKIAETNETVAIKKVLQDKRYKNRELETMKLLNHPNVTNLKYYFYEKDDKNMVFLNIVLDYVSFSLGKRLSVLREHKKNFNDVEIKAYMLQLLNGLDYLHEDREICHRDLKPHNILIDYHTWELKICDFGSAKHLIPTEPNVAYICSRYYRAPELIFGSTNYSTKIDMWSAGCVLGEMYLMRPLFNGMNGMDQLVEIIKTLGVPTKDDILGMNANYVDHEFPHVEPVTLRRLFKGQRSTTIQLLSKLLKYDPKQRWSARQALSSGYFVDITNKNKITNEKHRELLQNLQII